MSLRESLINSMRDLDQRNFLQFCVLLGYSGGLSHELLVKSVGSNAIGKSTVEKWMKKIKEGDTDLKDGRGGDKSDKAVKEERLNLLKGCMEESRHWSTKVLSSKLGIPATTVKRYLKEEMKMVKKLGKWIPHDLNDSQKEHRDLACRLNLDIISKDKLAIEKTLTIDETWVSLYMSPTRSQRRSWAFPGEPGPSVPVANIHAPKRMLILAMDQNGIAFYKLYPPKTTVNSTNYIEFLNENIPNWLRGKRCKRPMLLHDNARPHIAREVKEFLANKQITTWTQPPLFAGH